MPPKHCISAHRHREQHHELNPRRHTGSQRVKRVGSTVTERGWDDHDRSYILQSLGLFFHGLAHIELNGLSASPRSSEFLGLARATEHLHPGGRVLAEILADSRADEPASADDHGGLLGRPGSGLHLLESSLLATHI